MIDIQTFGPDIIDDLLDGLEVKAVRHDLLYLMPIFGSNSLLKESYQNNVSGTQRKCYEANS